MEKQNSCEMKNDATFYIKLPLSFFEVAHERKLEDKHDNAKAWPNLIFASLGQCISCNGQMQSQPVSHINLTLILLTRKQTEKNVIVCNIAMCQKGTD